MMLMKRSYTRNESPNACCIMVGKYAAFYLSFDIIVAFWTPQTGLVTSENVWSGSTGKHLDAICQKHDRIPNNEFEKQLNEVYHRMEICLSHMGDLVLMHRLEMAAEKVNEED